MNDAPTDPLTQNPPPEPAPVEPPKRNLTLPANRLKETEFAVKCYTVFIPTGHTPNDLANPSYWQHHAKAIPLWSVVEAISEDSDWEVRLRVIAKGDTWVRMRLISGYDGMGREPVAGPPEADYEIVPKPPGKYRVLNKLTKQVIADNCESRDEAIRQRDLVIIALRKR